MSSSPAGRPRRSGSAGVSDPQGAQETAFEGKVRPLGCNRDRACGGVGRTALLRPEEPHFEDLKLLSDHHDQLKRPATRPPTARTAVWWRSTPPITSAFPISRPPSTLPPCSGSSEVTTACAELIRSYVRELRRLDAELKVIRGQIALKIKESATTLTELRGVGPVLAAKILGEVGDIGRIRSKAAFAMLNGSAPLLASSGATNRHRLNRGGNRQLNSALHMIAVSCLRTDPDTRAYVARRTGEGKSRRKRFGA